jgi:site-specific DNA recombinase
VFLPPKSRGPWPRQSGSIVGRCFPKPEIEPTSSRVRTSTLALWLKAAGEGQREADADHLAAVDRTPSLLIPWTKPPPKRFKEILLPAAIERHRLRPIKFERRAALLKSIARGRAWLGEIISNTTTVEDIAARQKCSVRHVNMTISLAFIAPGLVKAAVEGRLPRGIGVAALRDAPAEWSMQFARLGLAPS